MPLQTPVVTIVSTNEVQPERYNITLNLLVADTDVGFTGINQDVSLLYKLGTLPSTKVVEFKKQMQAIIDKYKREKVIKNNALLATAVTNIQNGLVI